MPAVTHNAVILAGGRSARLGGRPKALLLAGGATLLETTLAAAEGAQHIAVAGPPGLQPLLDGFPGEPMLVREEPAFGGPAAAVAAGLGALHGSSDWTLVLACDMPGVSAAVQALLRAADDGAGDSLLALDSSGRSQPLAGLYRTADLHAAVAGHAPNGLTNMSMKALLARVQWRGVVVPPMSTADVDTWDDAQNLGVSAGDQP